VFFSVCAIRTPFQTEGWSPLLTDKDLPGWTSRDHKPHTWALKQTKAGPVIDNGATGRTADLSTTQKFRDFEVYLEFMIPQKSNSGVYVHGL
jgi:hypothetical protein